MERFGLDLVGFARLQPDLLLPFRARDWVAAVGKSYAGSEVIDTLKLLTSELATNALKHGGTSGVVRVALLTCRSGLRVEVTDEGGGVPVPRDASDDDEDGRGLFLLDVLARSWGHDLAPDGKGTVVWFEVDIPPSA
ncbi:anti-sigma regulatory factor (Ser/Thr protein kinase) [Actinocorallia herbida]|uniref:Anti-sigma regulatory factor (Ser/Thr protein kinase) n=1 Tax=Actinocorallia herbida TaxID=58109 RepID=A0A3N1CNM0_9ACTN|nr:ATP-binding protein [Actinocorallia herbida]ROO82911.1 anti-sigma regulatory factor (Ser/Thr protein kinase) [Actinocorallia herbida]